MPELDDTLKSLIVDAASKEKNNNDTNQQLPYSPDPQLAGVSITTKSNNTSDNNTPESIIKESAQNDAVNFQKEAASNPLNLFTPITSHVNKNSFLNNHVANTATAASLHNFNVLNYKVDTQDWAKSHPVSGQIVKMLADYADKTYAAIGNLLDVPDTRLANIVPTKDDMIGSAISGYLGFKEFESKVLDKSHIYSSISQFLGSEPLTEDKKKAYSAVAGAYMDMADDDGIHNALKWFDDHTFVPIGKALHDDPNSNPLTEWADKELAIRNAKYALQTNFSLDNDNPHTSKDVMNWVLNGISNTASSLASIATLGKGLGALSDIGKAKRVTSAVSTVGSDLFSSLGADAEKIAGATKYMNSMHQASVATRLGVDLGITYTFAKDNATQTANKAFNELALKYGGQRWKNFQTTQQQQFYNTLRAQGISDKEIAVRWQFHQKDLIKQYFPEDTYNKIEANASNAAGIAMKYSMAMAATNLFFSNQILKGLGYTGKMMSEDGAGLSSSEILNRMYPSMSRKVYTAAKDLTLSNISGIVSMVGVNHYAQKMGEAAISGKHYYGSDFIDDMLHGDMNEEAAWMAFMTTVTGGVGALQQFKDDPWRNFAASTDAKTFENIKNSIVNDEGTKQSVPLMMMMREAMKKGQAIEPYLNQLVENQVKVALKTNTMNDLHNNYRDISVKSKDAGVRTSANIVLSQLDHIRNLYNEASKYEDVNSVFENSLYMEKLNNTKSQLSDMLDASSDEIKKKVKSAYFDNEGNKLDAKVSFSKKNGIQVTGKDADKVIEQLQKDDDVQNFITLRHTLDKVNLDYKNAEYKQNGVTSKEYNDAFRSYKNSIKDLTSDQYSRFVLNTEMSRDEIDKLANHILNINGLDMDNYEGLADKFHAIVRTVYDAYHTDRQNQSTQKSDGFSESATTPSTVDKMQSPVVYQAEKNLQRHYDDANEDNAIAFNSIPEEQKNAIKDVVKSTVDNNFNGNAPSFDDFIGSLLNDHTIPNDQKEEVKTNVENIFNGLVEGWKANGYATPTDDYGSVYQKYFGKTKKVSPFLTLGKATETVSKPTTVPTEPQEEVEVPVEKTPVKSPTVSSTEELPSVVEEAKPVSTSNAFKSNFETTLLVAAFDKNFTPITNSNVKGERLTNPNRFNHGDVLPLKLDAGFRPIFIDINKNGKIVSTGSSSIQIHPKEKVRRIIHRGLLPEDYFVINDNDYIALRKAAKISIDKTNPLSESNGKTFMNVSFHDADGKVIEKRPIEIADDKIQLDGLAVSDNTDNESVAWFPTYMSVLVNSNHSNEQELFKVRELQKKIVNFRNAHKEGKVNNITINSKVGTSNTQLFELQPIITQDPTTQLAVFKGGTLYIGDNSFENDKRSIINADDVEGEDGASVELRKIGTNSEGKEVWKAFFLHDFSPSSELGEFATNNVKWVLKAFLANSNNTNSFIDIIPNDKKQKLTKTLESLGYDITKPKGFVNYISNFIRTGVPEASTVPVMKDNNMSYKVTPDSFKKYIKSYRVGTPVLILNDGNIHFGINNGSSGVIAISASLYGRDIKNQNNLREIMNQVDIYAHRFVKFHNTHTYSEDKKVLELGPKFQLLNEIGTIPYRRQQLESIKTKVKGFPFTDSNGSVFHTTMTNHTITISTNQKQPIVKSPKKIEENKELKQRISNALKNTKTEPVEETTGIKDLEGTSTIVTGLTPVQQADIVSEVMNFILSDETKLNIPEIDKKIKSSYKEIIDPIEQTYRDLETEASSSYPEQAKELASQLEIFDTLKKSWDLITTDAKNNVLKFIGLTDKQKTEVKFDEQEAMDKIYEKEAYETNIKDNLSAELKRLFFDTPVINDNGEVETGFLGLVKRVPVDNIVDNIISVVASNPNSEMTFTQVMDIMRGYMEAYPYLGNIIARLESGSKQQRIKFLSFVTGHALSMMHLSYNYDYRNRRAAIRTYNTNSVRLQNVIKNEWNNSFKLSSLVDRTDEGLRIIPKHATELLKQFEEFSKSKNKEDIPTKQLSNWLSMFGINLSDKTIQYLKNNGIIDKKNKVIKFSAMFGTPSKNSRGLFNGLAYSLKKYLDFHSVNPDIILTDDLHPFKGINTTLNEIANIEARYNSRAVTINFRSGGKNISGFIPIKYVTDRIDELRNGNVKTLQQDPYSTNSMWLSLLTNPDNKEVNSLFYITHPAPDILQVKGKTGGLNNDYRDLSPSDKEVVRLGFFSDVRQGSLTSKYNNIPMRMARMPFYTISDKKQLLFPYAPVLNLTKDDLSIKEGKVNISNRVAEVLYSQLFSSDFNRIKGFHKNPNNNTEGFSTAATIFTLVPEFNNIKYGGVRLPKLLATNPNILTEGVMKDIKDEVVSTIKDIVNKLVDQRVNKLSDYYGDEKSILDVFSDEYLHNRFGSTSKENQAKLAVTDFIVNDLLSKANQSQLITGDLAYYAPDKVFNDFGVDRSLIEGIPEVENLFSFGDISKRLLTLYNTTGQDLYKNALSRLKPLAYEPLTDKDYDKVTQKTVANMLKRMALIGPGSRIFTDNPKYRLVYLEDAVDIASNMRYIVKIHYGEEGAQLYDKNINRPDILEKLFPKVSAYLKIPTTDGQEYMTSKESLDVIYGTGGMSDEMYKNLNDKLIDQKKNGITKDNMLTDEEQQVFFQPEKPMYGGMVFSNGRNRIIFDKSAAITLLPQVTAGSPVLDDLRQTLEKLQDKDGHNVRAVYKSGAKVGATRSAVIQNGKLNVDDLMKSSVLIDRKYQKIQQVIPIHALHTKEDTILNGSQLSKEIFGDGVTDIKGFNLEGKEYTGRELLQHRDNTIGELTSLLKDNLYKELNIDKNGVPFSTLESLKKASELFEREAISRNYPKQDVKSLQTSSIMNPDGTVDYVFRNPIWVSTNAKRLESLVNSIITKRITKLRFPGYSYVAASPGNFKFSDTLPKDKFSRIIFTKHWNGDELLGAREENGEFKPPQVFVASRFRDNEGNIVDLFEGKGNDRKYITREGDTDYWKLKDGMIDDELLKLVTFRIPTSGIMSGASPVIAGFLPPEMADTMILFKGFTIQKGLDFDADKEFAYYLWHHVGLDGKIIPIDKILQGVDVANNLKTERLNLSRMKKVFANDYKFNQLLLEGEEQDVGQFIDVIGNLMPTLTTGENYTVDDVRKKIAEVNFWSKARQKQLENTLVRIHQAIYNNPDPEVQAKINAVMSTDFGEKQAELLYDNVIKNMPSAISDNYQSELYDLGAVGKTAIAIYAVHTAMNGLFQSLEVPVKSMSEDDNYSVTIGNFTSDSSFGRTINILGDRTVSTLERIIGNNTKMLEKLYNGKITISDIRKLVQGTPHEKILNNIRTLSDAFNEKLNLAADNAKLNVLGKVGVNNDTIAVENLLTLMGFDIGEEITDTNGNKVVTSIPYLLLSQPIIKSYIKEKENRRKKVSPNPVFMSNEELLEKVRSEYDGSPVDPKELTCQAMYDNIAKDVDNNLQLTALETYLNLESRTGALMKAQELLGITKNGLDQSMFNTIYLHDKLSGRFGDQTGDIFPGLQNADALLGDVVDVAPLGYEDRMKMIKDGYVPFENIYIKPTTLMGHLIVDSVSAGYDLWTNIFPYTHESITSVMNDIIRLSSKAYNSRNQRVDVSNTIIDEVRKFINSLAVSAAMGIDPDVERKRLFIDSTDNEALASFLLRMKNDKDPVMASNPILKDMFQYEIGDKISTIKFDNTSFNKIDEESIYNGFLDLILHNRKFSKSYNGEEYDTLKLMKDLTLYSHLSGGLQGAIDFSKYIPLEYLEHLGIVDVKQRILSGDIDHYLSNSISNVLENSMPIQYFQHFPDRIETYNLNNEFDYGKKVLPVTAFDIKDAYPKLLGVRKKSDISLYMLNGENYVKINSVGIFGMPEYSPLRTNAVGILNKDNKTDNVKQATLPRIPETPRSSYNFESQNTEDILNTISKENTDYGKIANIFKTILTGKKLPDVMVANIGDRTGNYNSMLNRITISDVIGKESKEKQASTFLHELSHHLTITELNSWFDNDGNPLIDIAKMPDYIQELYRIFNIAKKKIGNEEAIKAVRAKVIAKKQGSEEEDYTEAEKLNYAFTNVKEFVSRIFDDPELRDKLKGIKYAKTDIATKARNAIVKYISSLSEDFDDNLLSTLETLVYYIGLNKPDRNEDISQVANTILTSRRFSDENRPIRIIDHNFESDNKFVTVNDKGLTAENYTIFPDNGNLKVKTSSGRVIGKGESDALFKNYNGSIENYVLSKLGKDVYNALIANNIKIPEGIQGTSVGGYYISQVNPFFEVPKTGDVLEIKKAGTAGIKVWKHGEMEYPYQLNIVDKSGYRVGSIPYGKGEYGNKATEVVESRILKKLDNGERVFIKVTNPTEYNFDFEEAKVPKQESINIYAGTNENAELSNFAERPYSDEENTSESKKVNDVFKDYPELSKIGSEKQYLEYLDTIFPDSKVKDIVYHGSKTKFDGFLEDNLNYFGTKDIAKGYGTNLYPSLININSPYYEDGGNLSNQSYEDLYDKLDESNSDGFISISKTLFVPKTEEQIHILGSKQDIEGFKNFVQNNSTKSSEDFAIDMLISKMNKKFGNLDELNCTE